MRSIIPGVLLGGLFLGQVAGAADSKPKVNFQEQVSTIFRNRCNSCHNADKQKGGLNLETFGTAMQGGGTGKVIEPGDLEASTLYQLVSHQEQPTMPPNTPKIPDAEIEVIKLWIEGGAPETSGSAVAVKAKPKFEFKLDAEAAGKPVGPPAMPEGLATEPAVVTPRPTAVVAMAASPWAPLVAVGGYKQVLLYRTTDHHLVGVLPFPEGTIHVLRFSRNGGLLLAGGGRGGQSGLAVAWDVKTGQRVFEVGKEYDAVLAADISPDHGLVALGGPSKVLRVYATADGQLLYEGRKHTEWVTAVEFSPDGVLLASGDRNNGLIVWEAQTGREFFDLRGHTAAITDLSWRLDSNVVASSSEDGSVRLWEMEEGKAIKTLAGAHPGGVASVRFAKDGRLATAGRDRLVRLWDASGNKKRDLEAFPDLALEVVFTHDGAAVVGADWSGSVRVWSAADGKRLADLAANPAPLTVRLERANQALAAAEAASTQLAPIVSGPAEKAAALTEAQKALADSQATLARRTSEAAAAEQTLKGKIAAETKAIATLKAAREAADRALAAQIEADHRLAGLDSTGKPATEPAESEKAAAAQAAEKAGTDVAATADALKPAQADATRASTERVAAEKALADARAGVKAATDAVPILKVRVDQRLAEKAAADKALATSKPAIDAANARVQALRAEVDLLTTERKALEASKSVQSPIASQGS
jgi:hypothetical protein